MSHARPTSEQVVQAVHTVGCPLVLAVTGGGSGAISELLRVPGASRTVLEAVVPYASVALVDWLGRRPEQFCSAETARAMAMVAFERARVLEGAAGLTIPRPVAGLGCTASLASDRPKRGEHRAHLALQTAERTVEMSLHLERDRRDRAEEETLVAHALLNLAAEAAGLAERIELGLGDADTLDTRRKQAPLAWQQLLLGEQNALALGPDRPSTGVAVPRTVFPGAFNPLHEGHLQMAALAARRTERLVEFELSMHNVDKPPLDFLEVEERLRQFSPGTSVWLTQAATFMEKARLFPGATFVVGADTIGRIGAERYYDDDPAARDRAVTELAASGCRFLVFGRLEGGAFLALTDVPLPTALAALCDEVPEAEFRVDVSSTALRQMGA